MSAPNPLETLEEIFNVECFHVMIPGEKGVRGYPISRGGWLAADFLVKIGRLKVRRGPARGRWYVTGKRGEKCQPSA